MRRWVWRILLAALVLTALTGSALAADPVTLDNGVVLTQEGTGWKITGYTGGGGRVVLSHEYGGSPITSVGDAAFKNTAGRKITEVVFPNTITSIGSNAFENCVSLKTILFLPDSTGNVTIGKSAFSGTGVSLLVLPDKLTSIGESAFANNTSLKKVTIPDTVTAIGSKAFANNKSLKTVYIPEALKNAASGSTKPVSKDAFANTQLESIHYGGTDKGDVLYNIFTTMPPGLCRDQVHLATDSTKVDPPTCDGPGRVMGGGFCMETNDKQLESCKDLAGDEVEIGALGHDIQEPPPADFNAEAAKHKPCEDWTWVYEATCPRCGKKEPGEKKIAGDPTKHIWVDDGDATVRPPTCLEDGERSTPQKCSVCGQKGDPKVEVLPKTPDHHSYDKGTTKVYEILAPNCLLNLDCPIATFKVCDVCGKTNACAECEKLQKELEDGKADTDLSFDAILIHGRNLEDHLLADHADPDSDAYVEVTYHDKPAHTRPAPTEENTVSIKDPTCTEDGEIVYKPGTTCTVCNGELPEADLTVTSDKLGHDWFNLSGDQEAFEKEPTCTEAGVKRINARKCARCDLIEAEKTEAVAPLGHEWGSPVLDEGAEYKAPTCKEPGEGTGTITCTREGCHSDPKDENSPPASQTGKLTLPALGHDWGEWKTTKEPTATESGTQERVCQREGCGEKETRTLPPLDPVDPDNPDNPDKPDNPDDPSTKPEDKTYKVDVVQASNGVTTVSRSTAKQGDLITVTVSPASGYVLDMIRVISSSQAVSLTDLGDGRFRFTMPAADVEVRATFYKTGSDYGSNWSDGFGNSGNGNRTDPRRTTDDLPVQIQEQPAPQAVTDQRMFTDVPTSHWAAAQINWASQMGYMSGSSGRFDPDGLITTQQMWMVLARLTGNNPASMTEARRWAELGGYADGSSPTGAVKRHQLVTALYRCARLTGRTARVPASLSGFADSRTVPAVAREAFTWALSRGVVNTDAEGRIKPNEKLTRAQFAVILYSYSHTV